MLAKNLFEMRTKLVYRLRVAHDVNGNEAACLFLSSAMASNRQRMSQSANHASRQDCNRSLTIRPPRDTAGRFVASEENMKNLRRAPIHPLQQGGLAKIEPLKQWQQ
jgi:hypothetical protein